MKILYIGDDNGTSGQRLKVIKENSEVTESIDPYKLSIFSKAITYKFLFSFPYGLFIPHLISSRIRLIIKSNYDIIWVNAGDVITPSLLKFFKKKSKFILCYNNDQPLANRDGHRWDIYKNSLKYYDLVFLRSNADPLDAIKLNVKFFCSLFMWFDEDIHLVNDYSKKTKDIDIVFIGTWFPERGPFISKMIRSGINIAIYGARWNKADEWEQIKKYWKGNSLNGKDYTNVLSRSKISLGFVSEENQDLHTRRSLEIPAAGSLLCAQRTFEHSMMFKENEEAVFFDDVEECISICKSLLNNENKIKEITNKGHERVKRLGLSNQHAIPLILKTISKRIGRVL